MSLKIITVGDSTDHGGKGSCRVIWPQTKITREHTPAIKLFLYVQLRINYRVVNFREFFNSRAMSTKLAIAIIMPSNRRYTA